MKRMSQHWNKISDSSMSLAQFRMLLLLKSGEPQKVSQVAESLCITPGAITGVADKLIQSGLLERRRDENDRRVVYLQITPEGQTYVQSMLDRQKESLYDIFAVLPEEDIAHLKRIFTTLIEKTEEKDNG